MKIIRKLRQIKSKRIGSVCDITHNSTFAYGLGQYVCSSKNLVYSDEIPLPDYSFLTKRSSYWLEKKEFICLTISTAWHRLSLKYLLK